MIYRAQSSVIIVFVLIALIERHHPTNAETDEDIEVFVVFHTSGGNIVAPSVACKTLRKLYSAIEVEQPRASLKIVADEFLNNDAIGEAVVAFLVIAQNLRNVIRLGLITNPMFHKTAPNSEHETGIGIGRQPRKYFTELKIDHVAHLRNIDIGLFSTFADDDVAGCDERCQKTVFADYAGSENVMAAKAEYPIRLGSVGDRCANVVGESEPVGIVSDRNLCGIRHTEKHASNSAILDHGVVFRVVLRKNACGKQQTE